MKFSPRLRKSELRGENFKEMMKEEGEIVEFLDVKKWSVPEGYVEIEYYPLKPPFSYAAIID